jgi:hypothetical protein
VVKKIIIAFCLLACIIQLVQITYFKRGLFTEKYDVGYWKDRFEHSQWAIPLSKRIIGDDGLFAYIGYGLVNGGSISGFDSEVPPLGKYFIGLSIKIFNNPLYYSILFGLGSLVLFYKLGIRMFKDKSSSLFAVSILFLDPLLFSQFWQSTLDVCQLFFLLAHVLSVAHLANIKTKTGNKHIFYALISGIFLGLFAQVKYPILLPLIFVIESIFFILKRTKKEYCMYIAGIGLAILTVNIKFFIDGNPMIDFFGFQKYILSFYLRSQLTVHNGAILQMLFLGNFPSLSGGELVRVNEWWIMWPIISVTGILASILFILKKNISLIWKGFGLFILGSLFILTIIPSYPRYLVIILPFFYLVTIKLTQSFSNEIKIILCISLLLFGSINSFFFLLPRSDVFLNGLYYSLSHQYFHDVYQEDIGNMADLNLTRDQFRYIANKTLGDAGVKEIDIKELNKNIPMFSTEGEVKIGVTYKTQDLGSFYEEKTIKLVQKNGEWKIIWDWNTILNGFKPGYKLDSQIILGKRGCIVNKNGVNLAEDSVGYLLSVNPEKIDLKKEQIMLKTFSLYGFRSGVNFQNAYLENVLPNSYVPIFTTSVSISQKDKDKLLSHSGIILTPYRSRVFIDIDPKSMKNTFYQECCTRIYSSYNYHGINGPEKEFDKILWGYSGGKILMKDNKGTIIRVVFAKDKKDGKDVTLN